MIRPTDRPEHQVQGRRDEEIEQAAADQEDFVSMGMNTALKNLQIIDNAYNMAKAEFEQY